MSPLRSPEQLAEELGRDEGGNHHVSPHTIRKLARRGLIPFLRGSRGKILFDEAAIKALLDQLRQPTHEMEPEPDLELEGNPFNFVDGRRRR